MLIKKTTVFFFMLLLLGCGFSTEKRRPDAIEKSNSERSVKKISEATILNKVKKAGDSITAKVQGVFLAKISEQYAKGGFNAAAKYCSMEAYPLTDSLAQNYNVLIKRVSTRNRNSENAPSEIEKSLLEAYQYSHEEGVQLNSNVQFIRPGDTILYNKPIFLASKLCLNCHGDSKDISDEVKEILAERYPNDKATDYEIGELRGMWSLKFLKKDIVKKIQQ